MQKNRSMILSILFWGLLFTRLAGADLYDFDLKLDADKKTLNGNLFLIYKNTSSNKLNEIRLRLDQNLSSNSSIEIISIKEKGSKELRWKYLPFKFGKFNSDKGGIQIKLPKELNPSDSFEMDIVFRLTGSVINKDMIILQDDPYYSFDAWYPKAMTKINNTWSVNDDRPSFYKVEIELPTYFIVASSGKRVEEGRIDVSSKFIKFKEDNIRGFTIYCSKLWEKYKHSNNNITTNLYIPASANHFKEQILQTTHEVISFYSEKYGTFPTTHIDIVCLGDLDGRSHGSSSSYNLITLWLGGKFKEQFKWLLAHELAHQYFGSNIGTYRDEIGWASMGLGLLMDGDYMESKNLSNKRIIKTMKWFYFEAERQGYNTSLDQPVKKLLKADAPWSSGWNMSLMHGKAFIVCSMLENLLGQQEMEAVIKKIIAEKKGSLLSGEDLIYFCEQESGMSLDSFVSDWVNGEGVLDYAVTDVSQNNDTCEIEINNLGEADFPINIDIETVKGETIRRSFNGSKDKIILHNNISSIVLDPDKITPDIDRSNNRWTINSPQ